MGDYSDAIAPHAGKLNREMRIAIFVALLVFSGVAVLAYGLYCQVTMHLAQIYANAIVIMKAWAQSTVFLHQYFVPWIAAVVATALLVYQYGLAVNSLYIAGQWKEQLGDLDPLDDSNLRKYNRLCHVHLFAGLGFSCFLVLGSIFGLVTGLASVGVSALPFSGFYLAVVIVIYGLHADLAKTVLREEVVDYFYIHAERSFDVDRAYKALDNHFAYLRKTVQKETGGATAIL